MPLLGFSVFIDKVEAGLRGEPAPVGKRQTIRKVRKLKGKFHPIKVCDKLYLYTGLRTKHCRKLGEAVCNEAYFIFIDCNGPGMETKVFEVNKKSLPEMVYSTPRFHKLTAAEGNSLAIRDGFKDACEMLTWFMRTHGNHGALHEVFQVIRW